MPEAQSNGAAVRTQQMGSQDLFNLLTVFSTALSVVLALFQLRQVWLARVKVLVSAPMLITTEVTGEAGPSLRYLQVKVINGQGHALVVNSICFASNDKKANRAALGAVNDPAGLTSWRLPFEIKAQSAHDFMIPFKWVTTRAEPFQQGKAVRVEIGTSMGETHRSKWFAEIDGRLFP